MITYESEVVIDRPRAEVAAYIVDPSTHAVWMGDVAGIERLTPGEPGVGSRYRYSIRKGPASFGVTMRVLRLDDDAVEYQTEPGGTVNWHALIGFAPIDAERTRVTSAGEFSLGGIRRLLEPFMAGELRSGEAAELVALKTALEANDADR